MQSLIVLFKQCDQEKIAKLTIKVAQNDFTSKMIDFDNLKKLPINVGNLGKLIVATGFEKLPKMQ